MRTDVDWSEGLILERSLLQFLFVLFIGVCGLKDNTASEQHTNNQGKKQWPVGCTKINTHLQNC
jgi:hypothetical protein